MGEGKLVAVLALACGFFVGYRWPKLKKQYAPLYKKEFSRLKKYAKKGIQDASSLFIGRTTGVRKAKRVKRVLAKA